MDQGTLREHITKGGINSERKLDLISSLSRSTFFGKVRTPRARAKCARGGFHPVGRNTEQPAPAAAFPPADSVCKAISCLVIMSHVVISPFISMKPNFPG
jgi:hypothetical protein